MAKNDKILIDGIIDERISSNIPSKEKDEVFEYFAFEQLLKNYDLSHDELISGAVDGRDDGGIDGLYIFINGHLLTDIEKFSWPKIGVILELWIITCKHHDTFKQAPLDNLVASSSELLDLTIENNDLQGSYSTEILQRRDNFKTAYRKISPRLNSFNIFFSYVSRGDTNELGESIKSRSDQLKKIAENVFGLCNTDFKFYGSSELIELNRKKPIFTLELPFSDHLSSDGTYILLTKLNDYYKFISDNHNLRRYLFDSNVRDFMGLNNVNEDIMTTLLNEKSPDFWWLNNGITILATKASIVGKSIIIENIQIVNGLQTSESIYKFFSSGNIDIRNRSVLVKIIVSNNSEDRDNIIRATNNQTFVHPSALHATDKIQRDIEDALKLHNMYYERRVNFYKNQGVSIDEILTPLYLASGFVSLVLKSPQRASTLKSKFMRDEYKYNKVFTANTNLQVWPKIAYILKTTDKFLEKNRPKENGLIEYFYKHTRHYLSFLAVSLILKNYGFTADSLASFDYSKYTFLELQNAWDFLKDCYYKTNSKYRLDNEVFLTLCEKISFDKDIKGFDKLKYSNSLIPPKTIQHIKKEQISLTQEFLNKLNSVLPEQPWKPGVHKDICNDINCTYEEYNLGVAILIEKGLRYKQKDGIVYDKQGNILKIDSERVDKDTLKLKSPKT